MEKQLSNKDIPTASTFANTNRIQTSFLLKSCIFATGLSGIVAEYVMSTLASYLLGNAVLQWTLTVSFMLFAMGLGSRLSKYIRSDLLGAFIRIEFLLSILCAASAVTVYFLAAYTQYTGLIIYSIAISIGILIGLEIPLATRLNDYFEDLRVNVSSVMEKDYYGALLGGILFAFVALPYLGLTYTPIALGIINFLVAGVLFFRFRHLLQKKLVLWSGTIVLPMFFTAIVLLAEPIQLYGEQQKYMDRIIYQEQTPYQRIVMTEWRGHYWLYLNGNEQFSSFDEALYHEPLVHPAMQLSVARKKVLILGGGDGLAVREVLKYPEVQSVTLVDIDPAMTRLGRDNPLLVELNRGALRDERVHIINEDAYHFIETSADIFDVVIIDLPDPKTIDLSRLYTRQFYKMIQRNMARGGMLVTQASSPFFSGDAFLCILKTVQSSGLPAIPLHNHVPTLGEWGWVLAVNAPGISATEIKDRLLQIDINDIETSYLNREALMVMAHFGKGLFDRFPEIKPNDLTNLTLYRYYRDGAWDIY